MGSPRFEIVSSALSAFTASIVSSTSPFTRSSPSRLEMVTLNSDSISRTFSSNEPNKLTACSMRSMLMRCSMLCFLLKKC